MKKNHLNINKQFMVGNGILAFAVILVIVIFLYSSYRLQRRAAEGRTYAERYAVCLSRGFAGDSLRVHVNDSLVFCGTVPADSFRFEAPRLADECVLFVEDARTGRTSFFNLPAGGGEVWLRREGEVVLQEGGTLPPGA